ncbi:hypothetical protein CLV92_106207 [Kineococcus xinjiangensis]|uniref:Uncharacterized protein n=1 Tax=Kineococcus xinjiangensis TaxID=512762 RepID=A0A2S6IMK1_9ACTN|nr:hypothetical protein [Kineococcus xinjiangensis]PPK95385.1 hypothetical protein CLV92_106207 [Kineococcus xinjiangensis]
MQPTQRPPAPRSTRRPTAAATTGPVVLRVTATLTSLTLLLVSCAAAEVDVRDRVRRWTRDLPPPAEGAYSPPAPEQAARLARGVGLVRDDRLAEARDVLDDVGYRLEEVEEAGTGQRLVLVEPADGGGAEDAGWGRYVVRPGAPSDLLVEVPHPGADLRTELVGAEVFVEARAAALLVAGAHRDATDGADVAGEPDSAFQAVQQALLAPRGVVLQVHGFDADSHPDRYGDVVVSDGRARTRSSAPSPDSARLAEALSERGFDVCLQHRQDCSRLAGTRNAQGLAARESGASFVHLELARGPRTDARARRSVARAAREALAGGRGPADPGRVGTGEAPASP